MTASSDVADDIDNKGFLERVHRQPVMLLALGLIFLLIGICLHIWEDHAKAAWMHGWLQYFYTFSREFGFALIIAFVIAMGIERTSRNRLNSEVSKHLEDIEKNVFAAVYNTRQDPGIIELLETEIFGKPFFRTGYEIEATFKELADYKQERMFRVEIYCRYKVHNITNKPRSFHFHATVEKPYEPSLAHLAEMTSLAVDGKPLTADQLKQANENQPDTDDYRKYKWDEAVPADKSILVETKYTVIKYARDALVWQVYDPCDSIKMTVYHPVDITVSGDAIHSFEAEKRGVDPSDVVFTIRVNRPLFPNNGVQIWWRPKNGDVPALAPAAPAEVPPLAPAQPGSRQVAEARES